MEKKPMTKDRLAAFMDAVLAIIMTILVLELPKPDPMTLDGVLQLKDTYICYALSFFWLGTMWVNLHNEWHQIQVITKKVVWLGIVLLFVTSWIPYSMSVVAEHPGNKLAMLLYGMSVLLVTFANLWLSFALYQCHVDIAECNSHRHAWLMRIKYIPDIAIKLIGMVLTATVFPSAMFFAVLAAMVWILIPIEKIYHYKEKPENNHG
ncbi:TMEM175 family protein [Ruminococcus sp.]|uniref:TMEM175 family protein n=1 Tax=Ruminococcus sp. TaxID=41978 RepID=UPI00388D5C88